MSLLNDPHPKDKPHKHLRAAAGQRVICITAAPRAGTTALQYALKAAGIVNFGEIFHNDPLPDSIGSFLSFALRQDLRITDMSTRPAAAAIAERYLDWLREIAAPNHLLVDVKLNSWLALCPWWQYPCSEPVFLSRLKKGRAVIVFIWRENLVDQLLSQFIAREIGIWHNLTPANVAGRTFKAPVDRLKELATQVVCAEIEMLDHLRDYPAKVIMRYEDLFENGFLSKTFRASFTKVAGIALSANTPIAIRQTSSPKRDIIENYEEVASAIRPLAEKRQLGNVSESGGG
jgi:hypothetical protein